MKQDKQVDVHLAAPGGQVPSAASKGAPCPDRELLELAAKAAGIELTTQPFLHARKGEGALTMAGDLWNPLTDDGDALRLAVKLRINIYNPPGRNASASCWIPTTDHVLYFDAPEDDAAATRRAIVRAAAATGSAA